MSSDSVPSDASRPAPQNAGSPNLVSGTPMAATTATTAYFHNTPLIRKREDILVHKDELEEIRSFDISTVTHSGIGGFLCSTAISLVADEYFRLEKLEWVPKTQFCLVIFIVGALLCYFGFRDWKRKYNKLTKIIDQTKPSGLPFYEQIRQTSPRDADQGP